VEYGAVLVLAVGDYFRVEVRGVSLEVAGDDDFSYFLACVLIVAAAVHAPVGHAWAYSCGV